MESAFSFAPLRPAGFVNFTGRGGARPAFCGAGQPVFPRGGAGWGEHPWCLLMFDHVSVALTTRR